MKLYLKLFKTPWFLALYFSFMLMCYFSWDQLIATYVNETIAPNIKYPLKYVTYLGKGGPYIFLLFTLWIFFKYGVRHQKYSRNALFLLLSLLTSGILCDTIKALVCRARPKLWLESKIYGFHSPLNLLKTNWVSSHESLSLIEAIKLWFNSNVHGSPHPFKVFAPYWSFPSGHTAVAVSLMLGLSYLKPKYWPLFFLFALTVASSRILLNGHYLSDILGAFILTHFSVVTLHHYLRLYWQDDIYQVHG